MSANTPRPVREKRMTLDQYQARVNKLNQIVTKKELHKMTGLAMTTIQDAINTNKLIARKADAEEGERGGVWLIELRSAMALWSSRFGKGEQNEQQ